MYLQQMCKKQINNTIHNYTYYKFTSESKLMHLRVYINYAYMYIEFCHYAAKGSNEPTMILLNHKNQLGTVLLINTVNIKYMSTCMLPKSFSGQ